jgi:hypothetical protein
MKVLLLCKTTMWNAHGTAIKPVVRKANTRDTRRMLSLGMLCHMALVRTDVLEEHTTSIIKVTGTGKLGTMLAVTLANYCASIIRMTRISELATLAVTSNRYC